MALRLRPGDPRPRGFLVREGPAEERASEEPKRAAREHAGEARRRSADRSAERNVRIEGGRRNADSSGRWREPALGFANVRPAGKQCAAVADRDWLRELKHV